MSEDTLEILETTLNIIEQENSNLASGDVKAAATLLPRKEAALLRLELLKSFCENAEEESGGCCIPAVPDTAKKLDAALRQNRELLERALTAQKYIVALLANAMMRENQESRYTKSGVRQSIRDQSGATYRNHA